MSTAPDGLPEAPEFIKPPVVEMAMGVQFHPIPTLRGINLGPLRDQWRAAYPDVHEQAPLPPAIEGGPGQAIALQVGFGPVAPIRHVFLNASGSELVQLQNDRLVINWREGEPSTPYPRYERMRALFEQRLREVVDFVTSDGLGTVEIVQAELSYVNAIEAEGGRQGQLDRILRAWSGATEHHLGEPEQARVILTFTVPNIGRQPVRMYLAVDPAQRADGTPVVFLSFTTRGAPASAMMGDAVQFMDQAHGHLVRSFGELTPELMHESWGRGS